jgi:hypothetical protein
LGQRGNKMGRQAFIGLWEAVVERGQGVAATAVLTGHGWYSFRFKLYIVLANLDT